MGGDSLSLCYRAVFQTRLFFFFYHFTKVSAICWRHSYLLDVSGAVQTASYKTVSAEFAGVHGRAGGVCTFTSRLLVLVLLLAGARELRVS